MWPDVSAKMMKDKVGIKTNIELILVSFIITIKVIILDIISSKKHKLTT